MNTLYVHIGMPKTGTTAMQHFFYENRKVLNQKGFDYPVFSYNYGDLIGRMRNGHCLVSDEFGKNPEVFRQNMDSILEIFKTYPNIILSDEAIFTAPTRYKGMWKTLKEEGSKNGFQVKAILYLRRQDLYLCSIWNQYVKGKDETLAWAEFVKNPSRSAKMNFGTNVKHLTTVLGKDNVIVRRFEPKRFVNGSLYADFLQTLGLELTDEFVLSKYVRNTKLAGNTHEIMRIVNGMPGMDHTKGRFFSKALLSYADVSGQEYPNEMFSKEEAAAFLEKYREENRMVSKAYFNGEELFEQGWKDLPKWEKDNPHMQDDMIRFVVACCLQLMEQNEKLSREIDKLKHPIRTIRSKAARRGTEKN